MIFRDLKIAPVIYPLLSVIGLSILFFSCNPTKTLKDNEKFLQSNTIEINNTKVDKEELYNIIKQKPNKKILGIFRFHLGVYNFLSNKEDSKMRKNIGEPPVIYDSLLSTRSQSQLNLYLNNKGYFQNKVTIATKTDKKKIKQTFNITSGPAYVINDINYQFDDPKLSSYVLAKKDYSLIKKGKNFDVDVLDNERERIKKILKNEGYYYFTNSFIKYKIDTTIGNHNVNVLIELLQDKKGDVNVPHETYRINEINLFLGSKSKIDKAHLMDTLIFNDASIIYADKLKFKPKMLTHTLNFKPKEKYSLQNQNYTYKQLSELRLFKNIAVIYEETDSNKLTTNIYLTPLVIKSITLEGVGTNTGGDLGVEGNVAYQNKNIFRGGEFLNIKLKGGVEIQRVVGVATSANEILGTPFNTLEFGPEVSLEFPRFLLPVNMQNFSKRTNPRTTITSTFNFQQRPEYSRNLMQGTFGYSWHESQYKQHFITPFNISFVKLNLTDDFKNKIIAENNPFLLSSYSDHFISAIQYSFILNNQDINRIKNYQYLRFNFETSGNLLSSYNRLTNAPKDETTHSYNFAGIRYAEYLKTEFDLRFYEQTRLASIVERLALGVGVPYGNLDVLPFEKSYFGGGSNGIRAWPARSLGPGSLADSLLNTVNQIGELKIEANIEYRFDITKLFKGAFFIDAGNIWILKEDPQRPHAEINLNRFYNDIAIGVGFGLRLDFSFFIFRFDIATPLKDPSKEDPKTYRIELKKTTLNLGIGYPF